MSKKTPSKTLAKAPAKVAVSKATGSKQTESVAVMPAQDVKPVQATPPPPKEVDLKTAVKMVFDHADPDLNNSNKWPILIDEAERCGAFFRHRDTVYVQCYDKAHLETEKLRISILSAYFYGKTLVIDNMDNINLLELLKEACNRISANLFEDICDKTIVTNEQRYKDLIRESDGEDYLEWKIRQAGGFSVCFLTTNINVAVLMPYALPIIVQT